MNVVVTTDGSCISGRKGDRCAGGWAAIVETSGPTDGWVVRGRTGDTTSTQMELRAVIEGLRSLDDGATVEVRTDCMAVLGCFHKWKEGAFASGGNIVNVRGGTGWVQRRTRTNGRDWPFWLELARQFERVKPTVTLLTTSDAIHKRAHMIAQTEARAANVGSTAELPLPAKRVRRDKQGPVHSRGCTPGMCVVNCAVLRRRRNADEHRQRRQELAAKWRLEMQDSIVRARDSGHQRVWSDTDFQHG